MRVHELGAVPMGAKIRVLDQFGRHAYVGEPEHAAWLIHCGYAVGLGTKTAIRAVKLTVPLAFLSGGEVEGRAASMSTTRVKYTFMERLENGFRLHQHKRGITGGRVRGKFVDFLPAFQAVVRSVSLGGQNDS